MKRTAKILLSTMLVLMFVFSFAGAVPAAWAAYSEDGSIVSENAIFLWNEETETYDSYTGEVAIDFGKDGEGNPLSSISSIKQYGISFAIPDGLYVEKVTLEAQGQLDGEKVLDLNKYAVLSDSFLTIPASAFEDNEDDGSNILDVLDKSDTYVFSVFFRSIDPEAVVEVTYTDGELGGKLGQLFEDGDKYTVAEEGHQVKAIPVEKENDAARNYTKGYAGWKLVYPSGISMDVSGGSTVYPYMSCTIEAQWTDAIVVKVSSPTKTYDGTPLLPSCDIAGTGILADGEGVAVSYDVESLTDAGTATCNATAEVLDSSGNPVEDYVIYTFPGTLTVEKAPITIQSGSGEKVYDGEPMTNVTPTITGETYGEDSLTAEATGVITDVGEVKNTISYTLPGNKNNYAITLVEGTLKVTARPLTLTTNSATADYTGTALTKDGYTVDGLVEGHKANVTITGSQTVPGTSDNTADIVIKDADDKDVTANYAVTKKLGTLTVNALTDTNRIALTIAPEDVTAEYDGTAHGASVYKIVSGKLPDGVTLTVTYSGERTDAGEGETSIGLATFLQDGTDVTANFNVTAKTGKITVSQRPITVTADSATKEYDTKPLTKDTASVTSGALVSGHKLAAAEVVGSQTEVGESKNAIKENSVKITDAKGNDVTKNYAITLADGTLKVTGKAITDITVTVSATKVYDGTALTITDKDLKVTPALPSGYTISATLSPNSRTDAGKDEVTITNVVIKDASGKNVTASKFNVKVEKGTLEVTTRPLTITTGDKTKVYDGTALTDKTVPTIEGQLKAHNMKLEFTGSQTKVGSSDNSVKVLSIYDKETNADVTKNYKITYKFGKLTVTSGTGTTNSGTTNNRNPQTGDTNNIWLWIGLMVVAAAVVVVIIVVIRRKNKGGAPDGSSQNKE